MTCEAELSRKIRKLLVANYDDLSQSERIQLFDAAKDLDKRCRGFLKKGRGFKAFTEAYNHAKLLYEQTTKSRIDE